MKKLIVVAILFCFVTLCSAGDGDIILDSSSWCKVTVTRTIPDRAADYLTITIIKFDKNESAVKFIIRDVDRVGLDIQKINGKEKIIPEQKKIEWEK